MNQKNILIKKERLEKLLLNKHPWIFSGAVFAVSKDTKPGGIVQVADSSENIFAHAAYNPNSDIRLRILNWKKDETVDDEWFIIQIKQLSHKKEVMLGITDIPEEKKNYRVVFSDADSIPGLIIDRYGLVFVLQLQTLFADIRRDLWVSIIKQLWNPKTIYERSDVEVRKKEGLSSLPSQLLTGSLPEPLIIEEDRFKFIVDVPKGQKTGFFLDLRQVRRQVEQWCGVFGIKYLQNYFGYTGSFNLYASRAGVKKIEHIDISEKANSIAQKNSDLNNTGSAVEIITADGFDFLKDTKDSIVEAIILDPPSFVKDRTKIFNALDGYRRINSIAMKKLKPGGLLFSLCCSSHISEEMFQRTLFISSSEEQCSVKVIEKLGHDVDHSWPLSFPEGRYLQGWILLKD